MCIVQKQREWHARFQVVQFIQQGTDTFRCNVGVIGYGDQLLGNGVDCAKHIETLSPCWRLNKDACQRPEKTNERRKYKMSRIDKENGAASRFCFRQTRLDFVFQVLCLLFRVSFGRNNAYFATTEIQFFFWNSAICVSLRLTPVINSILFCASSMLADAPENRLREN